VTGPGAWASEAGGVVLIAMTSGSVGRTLLLPGSRVGFLLRKIDQATDRIFRMTGRMISTHERRSHYRAVHAPLILAAQLTSWLALFLLGFALLLWPQTGNLGAALKESGSSLFTLGFAATGRGTAVTLDIIAAATGLVIVALQIAYLPTLYSAFNRREADVSLLFMRAGEPAWGPELLARSHLMGAVGELPALYATWERWAAEVAESHSSYPVLLRFRSANPLSSWLTGFLAVLDSAALYASIAGDRGPLQARLFLRMGFGCLQQLAITLRIPFDPDPRPDAGILLTREDFQQGIDRLQAYSFPIDRPIEEVWTHFQGWRVNYESIVYTLAFEIDAPPVLWSGPRRHSSSQIAPRRLLDRTPEDPEGATGGKAKKPTS
jgi:hypothetical protein